MTRNDVMTNALLVLAVLAPCATAGRAAAAAPPSANSSAAVSMVDYTHEFKFSYPDIPVRNGVIFGVSVAISGDTALVGAMRDQGPNGVQGAAYVLVRNGNSWTQQAKLTAADAPVDSNFGHSVALSGDTALIGMPGGPGAAYVYVRSNGVWTLQTKLAPIEGSIGEQLGYAVALSGDTALIGVPSDVIGASYGHGSAFVFTRSAGSWSQQQKLIASDVAPVSYFGYSVALDGDTAAIGASYNTIGGNALQGAAYAFARSAGVWAEQGKLFADDGAANDLFGSTVAVSGDTAVVGAFIDDINGQPDQGSAYVFVRSGAIWSLQTKLLMAGGELNDQFGLGVAIDGDKVLVGARLDSIGNGRQGSVNVFTRSGDTWTQGQKIIASDGNQNDIFGHSLALSGDDLIVSAYADEAPGAPQSTDAGSVYFFDAAPPRADLQISITNSETQLLPGQVTSYEILVANAGPSAVVEASFSNNVPNNLNNVQWVCSSFAGAAVCPNAQGSGNAIAQTIALPVNGALRYLVAATVGDSPGAFVSNTATIAVTAPAQDDNPTNNSATDQDPVLSISLFADGFEGNAP